MSKKEDKNKKITILLNVYNAEKNVDKFFKTLKKQTFKDFKILVIDDGSTDKTVSKIKKYKEDFKIKIINLPHRGLRKARAFGISKIDTDIVVILDLDLLLDEKAVEELVKPIKNKENIVGVGGLLKGQKGTKTAEAYAELGKLFFKLREKKSQADWLTGGFCAFQKKVIDQSEGFATDTTSADVDISWKLKENGSNLIINNKAVAYHKNPDNLKEVWMRQEKIGKREYFLTKKYPKQALKPKRLIRFFPLLTPFFFLLLFIFLPIVILTILLSYIATILIIKNTFSVRSHSFIVFIVMNFAYCSGFLQSMIKKKK